MFNIKKKIYVQHMTKFYAGNGKFILLDGGAFKNTHMPENVGMLFRYDSLDEMLEQEFDGDIANFYDLLNRHDKLYIYTANSDDYARIFVRSVIELQHEFGLQGNDEFATKYMQLAQHSEFFQEGTLIPYQELYATMSKDYFPIGGLYDKTVVSDLPLEAAMQLYAFNKLTGDQINVKLVTLTKAVLEAFLQEMQKDVIVLVSREAGILRKFLMDESITSPEDIQNAVLHDEFLKRFLLERILDIDYDIDNIVRLLSAAFVYQPTIEGEDHQKELDVLFQLYKTPTIDLFVANLPLIIDTSFFATRLEKFNDLLIGKV